MALAIDASSPAVKTGTGTTTTTASFTPPANSLIVAVASCGNGAGTTGTTASVTITDSISSSWTLKKRQNLSGSGSSEIWMLDAGGSPSARTVTATTSLPGVALTVLVFTGAAAVASQTGTNIFGTPAVWQTSPTPTAVGSYFVSVGCDTSSNYALTANANTTTLNAFNDSTNGETLGHWRSTALTSSLTAISYGFTNTPGQSVVYTQQEVLAAATTTPISSGDSGTGTDSASVLVPKSSGDTGSGTEGSSVISVTPKADGDSGFAVEAADAVGVSRNQAATETITSKDAAVVAKSTWRFTPPSRSILWQVKPGTSLFVTIDQGLSVLKTSGSYSQVETPSAEAVEAADIAYLGGRSYPIDDTERAALIAAGYGANVALAPNP